MVARAKRLLTVQVKRWQKVNIEDLDTGEEVTVGDEVGTVVQRVANVGVWVKVETNGDPSRPDRAMLVSWEGEVLRVGDIRD